jgi:hypothetical protein
MNNNIWTEEDEKMLEVVLNEWLSEFLIIFKSIKKTDLDNFIFYAKSSFIYHNLFYKEYKLIKNHPDWNHWENLVKQFYLKKCRRFSIFS